MGIEGTEGDIGLRTWVILPSVDDDLLGIAQTIATYEDEPSQTGRPTGSARGGSSFEGLVKSGVANLVGLYANIPNIETHDVLIDDLVPRSVRTGDGLTGLSVGDRLIVFRLPRLSIKPTNAPVVLNESWLKREFYVDEWYNGRLLEIEEKGWVPEEGLYSGEKYANIHKGLSIEFDGTILFIESGVLRRKVLLECKSAKSSNGLKLDANVHERFSYQSLEYLELATLYPQTQLLLMTNDAFVRYKNKYHTGFGVHSLRLGNAFSWYNFDMVSTTSQYVRLFKSWRDWLEGK